MKRLLFSSLFLLIFLFSNAQSINVLENKNGYKIFKLNSNKSNYLKNLKFIELNRGYSTYNYVETAEYEIVNEYRTVRKKVSINNFARSYNTTPNNIRSLNSNIKVKKGYIKKNQEILVPRRKVSRRFPVDKSLFNLFDNKVNLISLTFDDSNNKLKKITLDLNQKLALNYLQILGYRLKTLYNKFSEVIGPTTNYNKPTPDCDRFPRKTCLYFEDRVFDGEILWESSNVVLRIIHKTRSMFYPNATSNLIVTRTVSFIEKSFDITSRNSAF